MQIKRRLLVISRKASSLIQQLLRFLDLRFIMMYKVVLTFESVDVNPKCDSSDESCLTSRTFMWCCLICVQGGSHF